MSIRFLQANKTTKSFLFQIFFILLVQLVYHILQVF